jgi:hypothetical protein
MITSVIVHQQRYRLSHCKENVVIQFSVSGIIFIISSSKDKNFRHYTFNQAKLDEILIDIRSS